MTHGISRPRQPHPPTRAFLTRPRVGRPTPRGEEGSPALAEHEPMARYHHRTIPTMDWTSVPLGPEGKRRWKSVVFRIGVGLGLCLFRCINSSEDAAKVLKSSHILYCSSLFISRILDVMPINRRHLQGAAPVQRMQGSKEGLPRNRCLQRQ